jgi:hypothetical protein
MAEFHLIDLVSQAPEVEKRIKGLSIDEKVSWLASHGSLTRLTPRSTGRAHFAFTTRNGIQSVFFFEEDKIVCIGDHTTFTRSHRD